MDKAALLEKIRGGLIVSCQALPEEPLHGSDTMVKMARAAELGGARGIRANGIADIAAIRENVKLPIIGLIKKRYTDSEIYITPTLKEIEKLVAVEADIIAVDATDRVRPGGLGLEEFVAEIRRHFPGILLMADISTYEEGVTSERLGFDFAGTTLCGVTPYTDGVKPPAFSVMRQLVEKLIIPVIAEGGIWTPEEMIKAFETGVHSVVVGTAITRPKEITARFCEALRRCANHGA